MIKIGARLKHLSESKGVGEANVAKALGVSPRALSYYIRDERRPSYDALVILSDLFDVSIDYLLTGRNCMRPVYTVALDGADYAPIPRVDARLAAGGGALNHQVERTGALAFRRDWLRERGISPAQACLLRVSGDSMTPTLYDGDLVMIDERRTVIRNRHVYALIDTDGAARVKRLDHLPDQLIILTSDNPAHAAETRQGPDMNRLRILGEIVWSAHAW